MTELFGTASCQFTAELREDLEWRGVDFTEYDVETDQTAREKLRSLAPGVTTVPVLVKNGLIVQVGVAGRGCAIRLGD